MPELFPPYIIGYAVGALVLFIVLMIMYPAFRKAVGILMAIIGFLLTITFWLAFIGIPMMLIGLLFFFIGGKKKEPPPPPVVFQRQFNAEPQRRALEGKLAEAANLTTRKEDLLRHLDSLKNRLIEGKISEETYKQLSNEIKEKLDKIEAELKKIESESSSDEHEQIEQ